MWTCACMSMYELLQKEGGWKRITHLVYLELHPDPRGPLPQRKYVPVSILILDLFGVTQPPCRFRPLSNFQTEAKWVKSNKSSELNLAHCCPLDVTRCVTVFLWFHMMTTSFGCNLTKCNTFICTCTWSSFDTSVYGHTVSPTVIIASP